MADTPVQATLRVSSGTVVVLIGPSSAGKSTWAALAFEANQIVSSDELRAVVGEGPDDLTASTDAFAVLDQILAARIARGLLTVVDTLGLDEGRRIALVAQAHAAGREVVAVRVQAPAATVRRRNKARARSLPARTLTAQLTAAERLSDAVLLAEGFDRIHQIDGTRPASPMTPAAIVPRAVVRATRRPTAADQVKTTTTKDSSTGSAQPRLRFGLHVGRFGGGSANLATHLAAVANAAEDAGFDSLWVMDHMIQIPQVGRRWEDMLESYTTLAYLAATTSRIRLGTLVTAITFRHLPHLAAIIATLDVLSGGRANCGLGAAWFADEHTAYGRDLPPLAERYDLLRDACQLLPLMWGPGAPAFEGRTITVPEAICYPRPLQERIPIMVGGSGERSTLRLVAEFADACNLFGAPTVVAEKVKRLHAHCADVGRDPNQIEVTTLTPVLTAEDHRTLQDRVAAITVPGAAVEKTVERVGAAVMSDQVARFEAYVDAGVDIAILSLPDLDPEQVAELTALIAAFAS